MKAAAENLVRAPGWSLPRSPAEEDTARRQVANGAPAVEPSIPLVVDLDGTLTPTDTLVEMTLQAVKQQPLLLLKLPVWLFKGRAPFKRLMASQFSEPFDVASLPYNQELLDYLHAEKARGRALILATAADRSIADAVADHLGIFDGVLATEGGFNLKGRDKLKLIQHHVGMPFSYAADHATDLPIWEAASAAVLVGVTKQVESQVAAHTPVERRFAGPKAGIKTWVRALRVHQWVKNILLFVPLLTAFSLIDLDKLAIESLAFVAFSLVASASYIVNDLLDLQSDRAHPRKRTRPFASADIPLKTGVAASALSLAAGLLVAALISTPLLLTLLCYLFLTSAYTWLLKRYVLIDVVMLSVLYTLRILAGAIAAGVQISSWLAAFSLFIFFSLALVKRCSELVSLSHANGTLIKGRDYHVSDLPILWPLGVGASLAAIVVFGIFINADETQMRYESPQLLWIAAIVMIYWIARLWIKTGRGEMHDDPIVYSLTNINSLICIGVMVLITMVAQFLKLGFP